MDSKNEKLITKMKKAQRLIKRTLDAVNSEEKRKI